MTLHRIPLSFLAVPALLALSALPAHATSAYWKTTATGDWGIATNWVANENGTGDITTVPGTGDTATFNYTGFNNRRFQFVRE